MTFDMLVSALRWLFWGITYAATVVVALVLVVGVLPLPLWIRWGMLGVVLWAIALDVRTKTGGRVGGQKA